jgi:type I restriction enzyme M protein
LDGGSHPSLRRACAPQIRLLLSNPPFRVEWKKVEKEVRREHERDGFNGRFGPGLPRVSDGSMLFLMHLLSKMRPAAGGGSRFAIVLNGSPLFTGGAGSGESEIRRYSLENDLRDDHRPADRYILQYRHFDLCLGRLQPQAAQRKGIVRLIDASSFWRKMRKSLGSKRKEMSEEQIADVMRLSRKGPEAAATRSSGFAGCRRNREADLALTGAV